MLKLSVLSPDKKIIDHTPVKAVFLPGTEGQIEILPGHAEMVGLFEAGPFSVVYTDDRIKEGVITFGFFTVKNDEISVLAETFEFREQIDLARAKLAQKKAEGALRDPELTPDLFKKYELKLQRALIRQQSARTA